MAKRVTGVGKPKKNSSRKTAKRLAAKRVMLQEKNSNNRRHNRTVRLSK